MKLPFRTTHTSAGDKLPRAATTLQSLGRALDGYLAEQSCELLQTTAMLQRLYQECRFVDALDLSTTMQVQTARLTTLEHIGELVGTLVAAPLPSPTTPTYYLSSLFLAGVIRTLLPAEHMALLTGAELGEHHFAVDTAIPLHGDASTTHIVPTAESRADAINYCWRGGLTLHIVIHTHPGNSATAVFASSTDMDTIARLQKAGHPVIGLVACDGGFFRFYSAQRPFSVQIFGEGYEVLDQETQLYRIDPELVADGGKLGAYLPSITSRAV